ncbi:DUF2336 domain-containing protein [Aureimonas sp. AU40]|uniref:DUF2336 domain-containing protein n=1 Tax=Aureimonas sp. AU40 TaxID=1637747 RepID=UPI000782804C|nr:DUF2336 domain-containing protein [Aureimonas sp. AU40]
MLAHHFVKWCETANTVERCAGVALLAEAVIHRKFLPKETREAEAALLYALEDVSPLVRRTIANLVASSDRVSRQLVLGLARDVNEIALLVVSRSPLLTGPDLAELAMDASGPVRAAIARRPHLPSDACHAIAALEDPDAALALAGNRHAEMTVETLRQLATTFGGDGRVRGALLERDDLPSDMRHRLVHAVAEQLGRSPFLAAVLGETRSERLREELQERALTAIVDEVSAEGLEAFVEHLRSDGALNTALLLKAVCAGRIDLFSAALARLTGYPEPRVRAIIAEARQPSFAALAAKAGLPPVVVPLLLAATRVWKDASMIDDLDSADVTASVMQRLLGHQRREATADQKDLTELLERLSKDAQRTTARQRMQRYLAA